MDSSHYSKMVYIPNLDKPELIDKYLAAVVERFLRNLKP
jgi:hypothetical protein